jgi:hypothetical protein
VLFEGGWEAGEERSYPFAFDVPPGPVSYWGSYVRVCWSLEARAHLVWARDPKATTTFAVLAGAPDQPYHHGNRPRSKRSSVALAYAALFLGGLLLVGLLSLDDDFSTFLAGVLGSLTVLIGAIGLLVHWATRKVRACARLLGEVNVWINPELLRPGESFVYALRLCPEGTVQVRCATAELLGSEQATYASTQPSSPEFGVATETRTYRALLHQEHKTLIERQVVYAKTPVIFEGSFRLPPNAAFTFVGSSNSVSWMLRLSMLVSNGHTWSKDFAIIVRP